MTEMETAEHHAFEAEVSRILEIVTHSLYSNRDIFLRELIANAADACERRRFAAASDASLAAEGQPLISVTPKPEEKQLILRDNGIGMSKQELIDNLGTIAASGTKRFVEAMKQQRAAAEESGEAGASPAQIGQFGVGFYSAFMVADRVTVVTRQAGSAEAWRWESTGAGGYDLSPSETGAEGGGTEVTLHLKEDAKEYLDPNNIRRIVKSYCDHIGIQIELQDGETQESLNQASALWTRPKSEITEEQYAAAYRDFAKAFDAPWRTLHFKVEGVVSYTALLFVPSERPPSIFHPDRRASLRLHVQRVFITDDCEQVLPPYLRFMQGVIDCEDLPLNVSRELLQASPVLAKVKKSLVGRVLTELEKAAEKDSAGYTTFWEAFGAVMKEGIYEDETQRGRLMSLARFRSTASDGWVGLADYVGRMKEGQEAIYTLSGDTLDRLKESPHLEGFRARGIEVLLMTDPVDDFWATVVPHFEGKPFKSVTRGQADLDTFAAEGETSDGKAEESAAELAPLIASFKLALGEAVKDVRGSNRLAESAVCLVSDEGDLDLNLERILRMHGQVAQAQARILELNPKAPVIKRLAERQAGGAPAQEMEDAAWLLFEQARLLEGEALSDPKRYAERMGRLLGGA